jgi:hypothetical protein
VCNAGASVHGAPLGHRGHHRSVPSHELMGAVAQKRRFVITLTLPLCAGGPTAPVRPTSAVDPSKPNFHSARYVYGTQPQAPSAASQRYHQSLSGVHAPDLGLTGVSSA